MEKMKAAWLKFPTRVRQIVVLIVGSLFIIAAALTGWLPGPGGIPLFLIGIAILATEFEWARKLRDRVLHEIGRAGDWYKKHRVVGTILIIVAAAIVVTISILIFRSR